MPQSGISFSPAASAGPTGLASSPYADAKADPAPSGPGTSPEEHQAQIQAFVTWCEQRLGKEKARAAQGRLCYEIARSHEGPLADASAALRYYQKAHAFDPQFEPTLAGLFRVHAALGQWKLAAEALLEQSQLAQTAAEQSALLHIRAIILEKRLGAQGQAAPELAQAATLVPGDLALQSAVERHARLRQDWEALAQSLVRQAELASADSKLVAALASERAACALLSEDDRAASAEFYARAVAADPLSSSAMLSLQALLAKNNDTDGLVALLQKRASLLSEPAARAASLLSAAAYASEVGGELQLGAQLMESAWKATPDDLSVLRSLADLYERAGDYPKMVGALMRLEARIEAAPERAAVCVLIAETMRRHLGRADEALEFYQKARQAGPGNPASVEPLCAAYEAAGQFDELLTVLAEEESQSDSTVRRAQVCSRMARIYQEQLGDSESAINYYKRALGHDKQDEASLRRLFQLLEAARRFDELIELHERSVASAAEKEEKFLHLFRIGLIYEEHLAAPQNAVSAYRRILADEPHHPGACLALQRAAEKAGDFAALVESLLAEAEAASDKQRKLHLMHRAGICLLREMNKAGEALEVFAKVLAVEKHFVPTLKTLSEHYEQRGQRRELCNVLLLQLATTEEGNEQAAHCLRIARLKEELGEDEQAVEFYRRAHDENPAAREPATGVRRCLLRLGQYDKLAVFLSQGLEAMAAGAERAYRYAELGQIYELRLGQLEKAVAAYKRSLADDRGQALAREGLLRVLEQLGDEQATAAAYLKESECGKDPFFAVLALARRAELLRSEDAAQVAAAWQDVLAADPTHTQALRGAARALESAGDVPRLSENLRVQLQAMQLEESQLQITKELVRIHEGADVEGQSAPGVSSDLKALLGLSPTDRFGLHFAERLALSQHYDEALAEIDQSYFEALGSSVLGASYRTRQGEYYEHKEPGRALGYYRDAYLADRANWSAVRGMSRIAERLGDGATLREAAQAEASVTGDQQRAARLFRKAADCFAEAGDVEAAIEDLKSALQVAPASTAAARKLSELLQEREDFTSLLHVLTDAAQRCEDPKVAAAHWAYVSNIHSEHLDDLPAAIATLERSLAATGPSLAPLLSLSDLLLRDRKWKAAVATMTRARQHTQDRATLLSLHERSAEVLHERQNELALAKKELQQLLALDGSHQAALRRLLTIEEKLGSAKDVLSTAERLVAASDGDERADALLTKGSVLREHGRSADAMSALCEAVALSGPRTAILAQLSQLLEAKAAKETGWDAYEQALRQYLKGAKPGEDQARALIELARVLRRSDASQATTLLSTGLAQNPEHDELRLAYVKSAVQTGQGEGALAELPQLLVKRPLDAEVYETLAQAYPSGTQDAVRAVGPLVVLGRASRQQQTSYASRSPQVLALGEGGLPLSLLTATYQATCLQSGSDAAFSVLEALGSICSKVFPPALEQHGVTSKERVPVGGEHPLRPLLDVVCQALGGIEVDLYPAGGVHRLSVLLTEPVGLVVPASFSELPEAVQVFYLARCLAPVARRVAALEALNENELAVLLGSIMRLADAHAEVPGVDAAELAAATKRLSRALPWLSKGKIEEAARHYLAEPVADPKLLKRQAEAAAFRIALVFADDLVPVANMREGQGLLVGVEEERVEAIWADLLPFWARDEPQAMRDETRR